MFLVNENVLEVWQAGDVDRIPVGTTGRHFGSGRVYREESQLKRADRRGEIFVCRNQLTVELREVTATLRRGPAGPGVYVLWCSLELTLADLGTIVAETGPEHAPLRLCEVEKTIRERLCDLLQSLGEEHDLTTKAGQTEIRNRILPEIKFAGYLVKDLLFRRVLTGDEYHQEQAVWATFQNGLDRLLHDEKIWKVAERSRLQEALAGLEGETIRALLTEQKTLEAERRVAKYVELFPVLRPAQPDRPAQLCPAPDCRVDLSVGQTFTCCRCKREFHVWHQAPRKPELCDLCWKVIRGHRRCLVAVAIAIVAIATAPALGYYAVSQYVEHIEARAQQRFDAKDHSGAFHDYCWLSDRDLDDIELHRSIQECARRGALKRQFLERYSMLIAQHPNIAIIHNYLGNAYYMIAPDDATGDARGNWERALEIDPSFPPPRNNLAVLSYREGRREYDRGNQDEAELRFSEAAALFKRYLSLSPDDAEGWANLSELYVLLLDRDPSDRERMEGAKTALDKTLELDPSIARRYKWAGILFETLARREAALGQQEEAVRRKDEALAAYRVSLELGLDTEQGRDWVKRRKEIIEREREAYQRPVLPGTLTEQVDVVVRGVQR